MKISLNSARLKGAILLVAIVAIPVSCQMNKFRQQEQFLKQTPLLTDQALATLKPDQWVILSGQISDDTPQVVPGLATAIEERYYSDSESSGWESEDDLPNQIKLQMPDFQANVNIESPFPYGNYQTITDPQDPNRRWRGYPIGTELTVVGNVEQVQPLLIGVSEHLGGSFDKLLQIKMRRQFSMKMLMLIALFLGLLLGLWPTFSPSQKPSQKKLKKLR